MYDCSPQVFGDEAMEVKIEELQIQDLGQVGEIAITKDDTLILKVRLSNHPKDYTMMKTKIFRK